MGWDGFALLDPDVDVVDMCVRYVEAVQTESCGRCIPCRIGTKVILDALKRIARGRVSRPISIRSSALPQIKEGSKCQIGQTGLVPVLDAHATLLGGL